jgi:TRAP-type C4-dicarboxylate transport system permease small subunit
MLSAMLKFKKWMTIGLDAVLIVVVTLLVLDVVWGVFTRHVLSEQAKWTEELARFLLIWVALLGSAVAFGTRSHLGVDFFVEKFHPDVRKLVAVFTHLTVLLFTGSIFIYGGSLVVAGALIMEQTTPALGWKMGYVYLALPLAGIFIALFTIENLIETLVAKNGEIE